MSLFGNSFILIFGDSAENLLVLGELLRPQSQVLAVIPVTFLTALSTSVGGQARVVV
jgi:hypothetical protein